MTSNILVTYATQCGLTQEFARTIADTLIKRGKIVDFRAVSEVENLSHYAGVVVGSAVRGGHWLPEAISFMTRNQNALHQIPAAYFTICDMMGRANNSNQWTDAMFHDRSEERRVGKE